MSWNGSANKESGNKPIQTQAKTPAKISPSIIKGILAGVLVVGLSVVVCFFLKSKGGTPKQERVENKRIHGELADVSTRPAIQREREVAPEEAAPKPKKARKDMTREERYQSDLERVRQAQKRQANVPQAHKRAPEIFRTASDQILYMVAQMAEGKDMPPMPLDKNFEKEFAASLKEPIEILDSDSEKVKAMKQSVMQLRQELSERLESGESAVVVLREYEQKMAEDYKTRAEIQLEAQRILDSGDRDGAQTYVLGMNQAFKQMGIKEIEMPMTKAERRALAEAVKKQRDAERAERQKTADGASSRSIKSDENPNGSSK